MTDIPRRIQIGIVGMAAHMTTEHRLCPESIPAPTDSTGERSVGGEAEPNRDTYQTGKQRDTLGKVPGAPLFPAWQAFRVLNGYASVEERAKIGFAATPADLLRQYADHGISHQ